MNERQQNAVNVFLSKLREVRGINPECSITTQGNNVEVALKLSGWLVISIGRLGGYKMLDIRSYPENGLPSCCRYPGNTAFDAALFGDKYLSKQNMTLRRKPIFNGQAPSYRSERSGSSNIVGLSSWQDCAEFYLRELWQQDQLLVQKFSTCEITCEMLRDLFSPKQYQVARSIPGRIDEIGPKKKYGSFANMLNSYRNTSFTNENIPEIIERECLNLQREYGGKKLLSAISKAFWMMKQHPVAIYDSKARAGLSRYGLPPGNDSYRIFFRAWADFFERPETQDGIKEAMEWLPKSSQAHDLVEKGKTTSSEIKTFSQSLWFKNRIADMRLCNCLA